MIIYDNNNYNVVVNQGRGCYEITNKASGIVEVTEEILPKAVAAADIWSEAIDRHKQKSKEVADVVNIGKPR